MYAMHKMGTTASSYQVLLLLTLVKRAWPLMGTEGLWQANRWLTAEGGFLLSTAPVESWRLIDRERKAHAKVSQANFVLTAYTEAVETELAQRSPSAHTNEEFYSFFTGSTQFFPLFHPSILTEPSTAICSKAIKPTSISLYECVCVCVRARVASYWSPASM